MDDNYTEQEHDRVIDLINDLPAMFFGEWGNWEELAIELANIVHGAHQGRQSEPPMSSANQARKANV